MINVFLCYVLYLAGIFFSYTPDTLLLIIQVLVQAPPPLGSLLLLLWPSRLDCRGLLCVTTHCIAIVCPQFSVP